MALPQFRRALADGPMKWFQTLQSAVRKALLYERLLGLNAKYL